MLVSTQVGVIWSQTEGGIFGWNVNQEILDGDMPKQPIRVMPCDDDSCESSARTVLHDIAVLPRGLRVAEPGPLDQVPIDIHVCDRVGVALNRGLLVQNAFRAHKIGIERVLSAKLARVLRLELGALKTIQRK